MNCWRILVWLVVGYYLGCFLMQLAGAKTW
jgi:hypothetical protein